MASTNTATAITAIPIPMRFFLFNSKSNFG
jgi:hypothetical protein